MPIELVGAQVDRLAGGVRQLLDGHGFKDDSIMIGDAVGESELSRPLTR